MAVNNKNEIVVTDFHNHSVKVSVFPHFVLFPFELIHLKSEYLWHGYFDPATILEAGDTVINKANTFPVFLVIIV